MMGIGDQAGMLEGIRIVDLTSVVFGPYCTQVLANLGADIIKVESPPIGDVLRYTGIPARSPGMAPAFLNANHGKESVVLDLKTEEGAKTLGTLIAEADVFIHNVREQAINRLGFGYEAVAELKSDIIYVHCTGFGSDGPYAGLQAYDDIIQAVTGTTSLLPRVDGDPRPRYFPSLIADKVAGLHAAYGVLGAVVHKLRTGQGQFVEVPMFETFANFMLKEHMAGLVFEPPVGDVCYDRQIDPHRQPFPTSDGHVCIVPYTLDMWDTVFEILGEPEFTKQEHFKKPIDRLRNQHLLYQRMGELTPARTAAEWTALFHGAKIPAMPVRDIGDILEDPHLVATDFFQRREHPTEGTVLEMKEPVRFSAHPPSPLPLAPILGQHTAKYVGDKDSS